MCDAILSCGTEEPHSNDVVNFNALEREVVASDKQDVANCAQGLLQLREELKQMQERATKSEELAAKSEEHMKGHSLELQQLREELNELKDKVKGLSQMQEGLNEKEAKVEKVTKQPPILATDAEHANVQLQKEEVSSSNFATQKMEGGIECNQSGVVWSSEVLVQHYSEWWRVAGEKTGEWSFGTSVWDAAAFLGERAVLLPAESVLILLLLFACIAIQGSFVIIAWRSLGHSTLDDQTLQGYHWWRTNIGHSMKFMDPLTMESLASRVCRADSSLHLSETQSTAVAHIDSFLDENKPFNGPLMCVIAVVTWTLRVWAEFRDLDQMALALRNLPAEKTVVRMATRIADETSLEVNSLSYARCVYLLLVMLVRSCVAGALLIAGIRFLVVTVSIEDLILNTVALEFILQTDELLYAGLVPTKTQRLMSLLRPLRTRRLSTYGGVDVADIGRVVLLVIFAVVTYHIGLAPELSKMRQARQELCAGEQTFSYSVSAGGFVQWADTSMGDASAEQALRNLSMSSRYGLLRSLIAGSHSETIDVFRLTPIELQNAASDSIYFVGDRYNSKCTDKLMSNFYKYADFNAQTRSLVALRDTLGNQSISTCYDVERHCNQEDTGVSARLFCPQTCGCQSPHSALTYPNSPQGCPWTCAVQTSYLEALESAPCVDLTQDGSNILANYARNLPIAVASRPSSFKERVVKLSGLLLLHGCMAEGVEELCRLSNFKSLSVFCPVRCQCNVTRHELCPLTC